MKLTDDQEAILTLWETTEEKQSRNKLFDGTGYCCLGLVSRFIDGIEPIYKRDGDCYLFNDLDCELQSDQVARHHLRNSLGEIDMVYSDRFQDAIKSAGYRGQTYYSVADYNDGGATFKQIAAACRAVPEAVFTNTQR